jgi:hypothetical protein
MDVNEAVNMAKNEGLVSDDNPIEVTDEVAIGDLSTIKEDKPLIPPTRGVKLRIKKAETEIFKEGAFRNIKMQLQLVDGIDEEGKYKNSVVFQSVNYYADPEIYTSEFFTERKNLRDLKHLLNAVELSDKSVVNDQLIAELGGQVVTGDITQKQDKPYVNKEGIEVTPDPKNEVRNIRAIAEEDLV